MPEPRVTDSSKYLRTYVNDHRGGAAGGTALARRILENNRGSALEADLEIVAREISEDAATLDHIAATLQIADNPVKRVIGRAGEAITRLKLSTGLHRNSPLTRLMELELLMAGIDAKRSLWRALKSASLTPLHQFDFERLEERAGAQRSRLVNHHARAARSAFGDNVTTLT
jgi:hypothetical protein